MDLYIWDHRVEATTRVNTTSDVSHKKYKSPAVMEGITTSIATKRPINFIPTWSWRGSRNSMIIKCCETAHLEKLWYPRETYLPVGRRSAAAQKPRFSPPAPPPRKGPCFHIIQNAFYNTTLFGATFVYKCKRMETHFRNVVLAATLYCNRVRGNFRRNIILNTVHSFWFAHGNGRP